MRGGIVFAKTGQRSAGPEIVEPDPLQTTKTPINVDRDSNRILFNRKRVGLPARGSNNGNRSTPTNLDAFDVRRAVLVPGFPPS